MNKNRSLGLALAFLVIGGSGASLGAMGGGRVRQQQPGQPGYRAPHQQRGFKENVQDLANRVKKDKQSVPVVGELLAVGELAKEIKSVEKELSEVGASVGAAVGTLTTAMGAALVGLIGNHVPAVKAFSGKALAFSGQHGHKPAVMSGIAALALTHIFKEELCRGFNFIGCKVGSLFGYDMRSYNNNYGYNNRNQAYGNANGVSYYQLNQQQQQEVNMHLSQQAQFNRGHGGAVAFNHDQMANQLFVKGWFGGVNRR